MYFTFALQLVSPYLLKIEFNIFIYLFKSADVQFNQVCVYPLLSETA